MPATGSRWSLEVSSFGATPTYCEETARKFFEQYQDRIGDLTFAYRDDFIDVGHVVVDAPRNVVERPAAEPGQCIVTGKPSKQRVLIAKAY